MTVAPPPRPRRMWMRPWNSRMRSASRSVVRAMPNASVSSSSVGRRSPTANSPFAIRRRIVAATASPVLRPFRLIVSLAMSPRRGSECTEGALARSAIAAPGQR